MQRVGEYQKNSAREQNAVWDQNFPAPVAPQPRAHEEIYERCYGKSQHDDRREVAGLKCERAAETRAFLRRVSCDVARFECESDHENEETGFRHQPWE